MNLAYVTWDDVHQDLACRLARAHRVNLQVFSPADALSGRWQAVMYDLDYLPTEQRDELLARLSAGGLSMIAAVHSYNLTRRQAKALRHNGVLVRRRLGRGLFRALMQRSAGSALSTS